jgi:hypothetical protein
MEAMQNQELEYQYETGNRSKMSSTVGYKPSYQKLCRYCHEIDVVITYEHVGNDRWKYVARNYNTGTIHRCYGNKREL